MKLTYKLGRTQSKSPAQRTVLTRSLPGNDRMIPQQTKTESPGLLRVDLLDSYRDFFGFKTTPFTVSADPRFFYFSRSHAEALNHVRYGIYEGLGFTMITGAPGTGKTMLSRYFLSRSGDDLQIIYITYPRLSARELLQSLVEALRSSESAEQNPPHRKLFGELRDLLLLAHRQSKRVVVFIDEAQEMDSESLEGLRLLSNLETEGHKLIHLVLFGQTELQDRLRQESLRQLDQRVLVRYQLLPLEPDEVGSYISHQLKAASVDSSVEFSPESVAEICQVSGGLPRLVNVLCERAMMSAFVENSKNIRLQNVAEGWESLRGVSMPFKQRF
jgi:general secretion pathway protein A